MNFALILAAVVVGTWNGNWFPSGRAEHRANPEVEAATIAAAGKMLRAGIDALDPAGTNDVILCCNEIRGPRVARALADAIGRKGLALAAISGYRRRDRFDQQQDVILTTLPVASASWSLWKKEKGILPPRGYAHARVVLEPAVTAAVYAVHLKSNYGATTAEKRADAASKRACAVDQLVAAERRRERPVLLAGDFNADRWGRRPETLFATLVAAGFADAGEVLPASARATHPNVRYGDSTLDYIFPRGFIVRAAHVEPARDLSDHAAFFALLMPVPSARFSQNEGEAARRRFLGYCASECLAVLEERGKRSQ